ncbi:MAG: hypothetical protein SPI57_07065 [Prevotella sp.]|nr:hypothetical protein [Prevotella sp.]
MDLTSLFIVNVCILFFVLVLFFLDIWGDKGVLNPNERLLAKNADTVSDKMNATCKKCKAAPWYLVVHINENDYPIWISNNNIRSVHPDPKNNKIIIKQFNGEDMIIENVECYMLRPADELSIYDM